jgi:nitrate/nitrite transporter NarK
LINSIGNLGAFVGPYAVGWIKDATGETTLGLVVLAACSIMGRRSHISDGPRLENGDDG